MAKRKVANKRQSQKHSKNLILSDPAPDYTNFEIKKNQEVPEIRQASNFWDHLIAKLDKGDAIEMNQKEGISFTNRARTLKYLIISRKRANGKVVIWFGGLKK